MKKRIGQAKAKQAVGMENRKSFYGVYDTGIIKYEGFEFTGTKGNTCIEALPLEVLPLQQPLLLKDYIDYLDVHYDV